MKFRLAWLIPVFLVLHACGGGSSADVNETVTIVDGPPKPPPEPPPEPQPGVDFRVFRLGAGVVQMLPIENLPLRNGNADFPISSIAGDVDFIKIVADYIGIPYDIFSKGPEIPENHAWTIAARQLISDAHAANRPLLLQLGFVRSSMVGRAVDEDGELLVDLTWAPSCYDFSQPEAAAIGDAYVNYATWMVKELKPAYVVNFAEANIYYAKCGGAGASWDALVAIQRRAYDAIKNIVPDATVFASFNLENLYEDTLDGWDEEQYQGLAAMAYDTFAMASYPFGITKEGGVFVTPYDLPSDYLSRVLKYHPDEKRLSIVETGWNSISISVGDEDTCFENFPYSEQSFAGDYLDFVLNSAHTYEFDLLIWFSFRDALPGHVLSTCYVRTDGTDPENDACLGDFWCLAINQAKNTVSIPGETNLFSEVVLKAFGAMGLKEYDGVPRNLLFDRWRKTLALPLQHELKPASEVSN